MSSRYFGVILAVILLVGCGYNPEKPVYDTAKNPDNFPRLALALLDNIESDQLTSFEQISGAFGELYTEHSELLDNDDWKRVIDRLGARFAYKADQLLKDGLSNYTRAAGYYVLAAFARPKDRAATERGTLFSTWLDAVRDSEVAALVDSLLDDPSVNRRLELARRFVLADSVHREFAREYLISELFSSRFGDIASVQWDELALPQIALASYMGLVDPPLDRKAVSFGDGLVDLICTDISPIDSNVYLAAFYFYPHTHLEVDYTILLRIGTANDSLKSFADHLRFVPFDFRPEVPTSQWKEGAVAVAYRTLDFLGSMTEISVGLMDKSVKPVQFLSPVGTDDKAYRLVLPREQKP